MLMISQAYFAYTALFADIIQSKMYFTGSIVPIALAQLFTLAPMCYTRNFRVLGPALCCFLSNTAGVAILSSNKDESPTIYGWILAIMCGYFWFTFLSLPREQGDHLRLSLNVAFYGAILSTGMWLLELRSSKFECVTAKTIVALGITGSTGILLMNYSLQYVSPMLASFSTSLEVLFVFLIRLICHSISLQAIYWSAAGVLLIFVSLGLISWHSKRHRYEFRYKPGNMSWIAAMLVAMLLLIQHNLQYSRMFESREQSIHSKVEYHLNGPCTAALSNGVFVAASRILDRFTSKGMRVLFRIQCHGHWSPTHNDSMEIRHELGSSFKPLSWLKAGGVAFSKGNFCTLANGDALHTPVCLSVHQKTKKDEILTWMGTSGANFTLFLFKPNKHCCGRGIFLIDGQNVDRIFARGEPQSTGTLQGMITRPILFNGFKVDIRVFGVVTSMKPLRFYISRSGFFRSTYPNPAYDESNILDLNMHVTNEGYNGRQCIYSSDNATNNQTTYGTLGVFQTEVLVQNGLDSSAVWKNICIAVAGALRSVLESIKNQNERTISFMLWADVGVDKDGKAFVLEMDPNTYVLKPEHGCYRNKEVQREAYKTVLASTLLTNLRGISTALNLSEESALRLEDEISETYLFERLIPFQSALEKKKRSDQDLILSDLEL